MRINDFNGEGKWSRDAILDRYACYCRELGIAERDLSPLEHTNGIDKWIYPVMDKVIEGIKEGDEACKRIGIEFIEEDTFFSFGKILKSNTARALRQTSLTEDIKERIRVRVVHMLLVGNVPHEYKEYAKLLRNVGLGDSKQEIEANVDRSNPYVMRYYRYFMQLQ